MITDYIQDRITSIHPELEVFREEGGIFDVPPCDLDLYNGRTCKFINPQGENEYGLFVVMFPQKLWDDKLALRIVSTDDLNNFGRPACLEDLEFLD